jgi:hypothetical protein
MNKKDLIELLKQDYHQDIDWNEVINIIGKLYFCTIRTEEAIFLGFERERNSL